jgi:broad specificity phosphatase PhoE
MKILLIRHGKPKISNPFLVNANSFKDWLTQYKNSSIMINKKLKSIEKRVKEYDRVYSSSLNRAKQSANLYSNNVEENKLFNEAEIPIYNFKIVIPLSLMLFLSRFLWFLNFKIKVENIHRYRERVKIASNFLIDQANTNNSIALFGHKLFNMFVSRQLIENGFKKNVINNSKYWHAEEYEKGDN